MGCILKKYNQCDKLLGKIKIGAISNLILAGLIFSVGAFALAPLDDATQTDAATVQIYRSVENSNAVSLMFNVYWGTEEVYRILDILKENGAVATFFIGGCWADDNVQCLRDIATAGHEIGNHGYFHKDHARLSATDNEKEISQCNRFIELSIGKTPTLFAPPSGAYGETMLSVCQAMNMKTILWSRDTIDWRDKDKKLIYKRATKDIQGGEFVLMHPMAATVEALGDILKYYQTQGLTTATVSENIEKTQG